MAIYDETTSMDGGKWDCKQGAFAEYQYPRLGSNIAHIARGDVTSIFLPVRIEIPFHEKFTQVSHVRSLSPFKIQFVSSNQL